MKYKLAYKLRWATLITRDLHLLGRQDGVFCYHPHCPPACTYRKEVQSQTLKQGIEASSVPRRVIAVLLTSQGCSL